MSHILPDVLQNNLIIVFCGTAASTRSAQVGAYYGNPTNAFWHTLYEIGLTANQYEPIEFRKLVKLHIGLTDVAKGASGNDSDLKPDDFDSEALIQKIEHYQPQILAFTSKRAYRAALDIASHISVDYGWQDKMINQTRIYVLPSPSGAARAYWDISVWQALAAAYQELRIQYDTSD